MPRFTRTLPVTADGDVLLVFWLEPDSLDN
jgi:hypothetical protein